jgi:heterodisulfide reductase subunit B
MRGKNAFFLGCMIPLRLTSVEIAARRVFDRLNVEFLDLEGYTCCPEPVTLGLIDKELWVTSAARNLALAERAGADLVVLCSGCYETLIEADEVLKHENETRKRVNERLAGIGSKYEGKVKIKHFIEFLYEDIGLDRIKKEVITPVEVNLAIHYGCHLSREVDGGDPWRKPRMMKNLVEATGAKVSDYRLEKLCCGFPISQFDREFSLQQRLLLKLRSIENTPAEAIVFACPACIGQFEYGQDALTGSGVELTGYPCIHIMELLALSFGVTPAELNLDFHSSAVKEFAECFWE